MPDYHHRYVWTGFWLAMKGLVSLMATSHPTKHFSQCTVKTNALKKTCCCVNWEIHIFYNILIFKTCHLHLDIGSNIYLVELLVGHRKWVSSLSFNIICAAVTLQHVEKVFPGRCFWLTLFWKHFFNMLKCFDCRKDALNYNHIKFFIFTTRSLYMLS